MSTSYRRLPKYISSIVVLDRGPHCKVTIYNRGANAGTLCVQIEDKQNLLNTLFEEQEVVRSTTKLYIQHDQELFDHHQLLSEYGELTTFGEVRGTREPVKTTF